jgi:transcriptional regulator with XRE-family HTH domain
VNLEKLGTLIHTKREEVGIPLAKAAQKAGIGRSTLWILERGKSPQTGKPSRPSKDILERLAEVLHMSQAETEGLLALADYKVTGEHLSTSRNVPPAEQWG